MGTARRFVNDESGMTMALAMMMILLIGVMGAGILTFVRSDLNTVTEENRGQRAFEVADAGIEAAKRQLASNVVRTEYDGAGTDDIQWSYINDGLTLNDLDETGTTSDSVNVTIRYRSATDDFRVISTGTYGDPPQQSMRRIEAIFKGIAAGGGGEIIGHPLYYTPSNIKIESTSTRNVTLSAMSLFTEGDILIQGLTTAPDASKPQSALVADFEDNGGAISTGGTSDKLCDWDSAPPITDPQHCFVDATGGWNDTRRLALKNKNSTTPEYFDKPGMAAEGKICRYDPTSPTPAICGSSPSVSVADGVYGYDSTTGAKTYLRKDGSQTWKSPWGNNLMFVDKEDLVPPLDVEDPNPPNTITYPFPRPVPIPAKLKEKAINQGRYYKGPSPPWDTLFNNSDPGKVVFVDGENSILDFSTANSQKNKGTLVVWCGDFRQNQSFQGIIINVWGSDLPGNTSCGPGTGGLYRNNGVDCQCWTYAAGGTDTRAGIEIAPGSTLKFVPSGDFSFLNDAFEGPPPTSFAPQAWRELYQASP